VYLTNINSPQRWAKSISSDLVILRGYKKGSLTPCLSLPFAYCPSFLPISSSLR